ncbi:MAG: hypothetical protein HRT58_04700 [Crocinitomicaceae bacterium]|nr:hypothetical protein [Flavobacteriales bacterium]NQZ34937.1 hypothetical protein [Crocinitomicaceae bacterium]
MRWCYFCFILLLAGSCTLSSGQEATLHKAVTSYVDAHNNGAVMAYVGYTHPNIVGFYENQGDSIFRQKFELFSPENGGDYIQEGNVKEIEKRNGQIHVRYLFDSYTELDYEETVDKIGVIALSLDDGVTWFFAEEEDYKNEKIFSKDEQLIAL